MQNKVSVIIPLYNKVNYIERALRSVLAQTHQDFEIVVVDDGSTDGSGEVVKAVEDTRIVLVRQDNAGVSAARNKGIELAEAELIAFLDADDEWDPWFLETILQLVKDCPDAGMYGTAYRYHMADGSIVTPDFPGLENGYMKSFFRTSYIWTSATAVKKEAIQQAGMFPVGVRFGEDLDTWVRIALKHPVAWSNKVCAAYYNIDSSVNCSNIMWVGDAPYADAVWSHQDKIPQYLWNDLYELLCSQRLRGYVLSTYFSGDSLSARKMLRESRKTKREKKRLIIACFFLLIPNKISFCLWRKFNKGAQPTFRRVTGEEL